MKASDTIMTEEQIFKMIGAGHSQDVVIHTVIAHAQAEITWDKAIREVVEHVDNMGLIEHNDSPLHKTGATILDCPACCWYAYKAKLKEWEEK